MADCIEIRDVWNDNLDQEFALIREIVDEFNVVAMDTEFPGIVLKPLKEYENRNDFNYQQLKFNVNVLKLIQLGLTFTDKDGNLPTEEKVNKCIWQFNFRDFNENEDICAKDSIGLLKHSGIDFEKNRERGIDTKRFGELLMSSGVVLNEDICWVTFQGGSDFGYLLKLLTQKDLPEFRDEYFDLIEIFFPVVYDVKHLMKFCNNLYGGLSRLAELLKVERFGVSHQSGSDSLLTRHCFQKMKEMYFDGSKEEKHAGVLHGLNDRYV